MGLHRRLDPAVVGHHLGVDHAGLHLGPQRGEDLSPLALDVGDGVLADRLAALLELVELLGVW
jgi:hypothetical protein